MKKLFLIFSLIIGLPVTANQGYYSVKSVSVISPRNTAEINAQILQRLLPQTVQTNRYSSGFGAVAAGAFSSALASSFLDPYIVNIDGKDYVMVIDSKNNSWNIDSILGSNDQRHDLFASLKALETDGDNTKITTQELKKANIRFSLLKSNGSLALNERKLDYDINRIEYIDMQNLRYALGNKNSDGTFGYFYVLLKNNGALKPVPGRVTFAEKEDLQKLISAD